MILGQPLPDQAVESGGVLLPSEQVAPDPVAALRGALIQPTIQHAMRKSTFYGKRFAGFSEAVLLPQDLHLLPILTKDDILRNLTGILCGSDFPALTQHTTGTTGKALKIYRSASEISFIREFFGRITSAIPSAPIPIVFHLADMYHGASLEIPGNEHTVVGGVTDDILLHETVCRITEKHIFPQTQSQVSVLVGLVPYIKTLTTHLLEIGFDFSTSAVKTIIPICTVITPRWRKVLQETWGANIIDRYSLSEIFGGATYCLQCESFHFDPLVIPEVVSTFTKKPMVSGTGILLLTSLYPFVQKQPMIRYWTNDLVEIIPSQCRRDLSIKFKGRLENAILTPTGSDGQQEILVYPVDLYEVLDSLPDIATSERFIDVRCISDHSASGSLKSELITEFHDQRKLRLRVELRYTPHLYPDRVQYLSQHIRSELLKKATLLRDRIDSGRVGFEVEFYRPDSLKAHPIKV